MQIPLLCLSYLAPCGFGGTTGRESVLEFVPRAGPCPLVGLAWVISIIVSDFIGNPCKCISSDEKSFQIYQLMKKPPLCWQPSASSPHHSHSSAAPAKTQFFCLQYFSVSYLSDDGCHPLLVDALAHSFVLQMVRCVSSGGWSGLLFQKRLSCWKSHFLSGNFKEVVKSKDPLQRKRQISRFFCFDDSPTLKFKDTRSCLSWLFQVSVFFSFSHSQGFQLKAAYITFIFHCSCLKEFIDTTHKIFWHPGLPLSVWEENIF